MNIVYKTRVILVNMGKMLPFVLCGIILVSYSETMFSLATSDFVEWNGYIIPNTPISWFVGNYFEYDLVTLFALLIMSIAVQTCFWNKLSLLYLFLQLKEKEYLLSIELYPECIYVICIANILICSFFCYKGIRILTSSRKQ
jgi:hypothetical protein